ncbi:MAG: YvcK family protein [Chlamydiia bacterium]|nr:YvcK family protein [Chlamydiia bacterium]
MFTGLPMIPPSLKKVVVIGGGTGNFVVLEGLKKYPLDLTAVVSMADDGGSTGILRDELGVLPPGDVRQCLVALSNSSRLMRSLMNYRFENGGLGGHSFGNLLLSALEKVTGSFEKAVEEAGKILYIKGKVLPITTHQTRLKMVLDNRRILEGEREIYLSQEIDQGYTTLYLEPHPKVNPRVIEEIASADLLVMGPGGLHTSLIPNLLVEGVCEAICKSYAKKVFVVNLMNRKGQTTGFKTSDYLRELVRYLGKDPFDYIMVNVQKPPKPLIEVYANEGDLVDNDLDQERVIFAHMIGGLHDEPKRDLLKRSLIRHDSKKLAQELMKIVDHL